jgi:hypothetical protein
MSKANSMDCRVGHAAKRPKFWMDDRGLVVTDAWLQSDRATSDYRAVYTTPVRRRRSGGYVLDCPFCGGNDDTPPEHTQDCSRPNTTDDRR